VSALVRELYEDREWLYYTVNGTLHRKNKLTDEIHRLDRNTWRLLKSPGQIMEEVVRVLLLKV
jgi:hypothetical protein